MTILEYFDAKIGMQTPDNFLEGILLDNDLIAADTYVSATHQIPLEICLAYAYRNIATFPKSFKQGSYSLTKEDAKVYKNLANDLFKKNDLTDEVLGKSRIKMYIC